MAIKQWVLEKPEEPEGFETSTNGQKVCKLKKSLYGVKQSSRQWNRKFNMFLESVGLQSTDSDPCLYTNKTQDVFFALYVDDGLLAAQDDHVLTSIITVMKEEFKVTVGKAEYFVGLQIERTSSQIFLHQQAYTKRILQRFGMSNASPVRTAADACNKLKLACGSERADDVPYRELVGSVMFLMVSTRPDIAYAVSSLSKYLDKHQKEHWTAAKRLLRYLNGTQKYGIRFGGSSPLVGFCDADFAGDEDSRHSHTGLVFIFNNGPLTWLSQSQSTVSTSTCEAELTAAFAATKEAIWLKRLLSEVGYNRGGPVKLFIDNQGTIKYIQNPLMNNHKRSKHWDIRFKFTKEMEASGVIKVEYVPTTEQLADILTKPLTAELFTQNVKKLNMLPVADKFSLSGSVGNPART